MKIIEADKAHADIIGYIHSTAWKQTYRNIFPSEYLNSDTADQRRQEFLKSYKSSSVHYYLVCEDKTAAGIVKIETKNVWECEVSAIYILESCRNNGCGTEIIRFVKSNFEDYEIIIWVLEENVKAKSFYEKNNFDLTDKSRRIWRGNYYRQVQYESWHELAAALCSL